jgi:hypothetical protein
VYLSAADECIRYATVPPVSEWDLLRQQLSAAGVAGAKDLGRFVGNPEFFGESQFDELAAMPVLVASLPSLTDPTLVTAVAGHLTRPWARPAAFPALLAAFEEWGQRDPGVTGWHLGDALGTTATAAQVESLVRISKDPKYGMARQMVVHALGRFKKAPEVLGTLLGLLEDPDVALHAMQALRRVLGPREALPHLERVEREHQGTAVGNHASREAAKVRKASS